MDNGADDVEMPAPPAPLNEDDVAEANFADEEEDLLGGDYIENEDEPEGEDLMGDNMEE